ncbi:hypothetical protein BD780_002965 [Clostridium tetanomorphum]|uniref:Uncharacterized protein n=1 Tax=Clostridium tetanomorphum TaxID=1553 RepID=A0A923E8R8_CLOTT|nr:hypothetical protein [Clostridium tetanomorphum]KAJ53695.1 hypothetical protein CTM_00460 [Clostridium tetanomorphum DSM 665]MBC2397206.1 hypothetical protein [Clostridium tetanomorphum]MBP1862420.1 hypothetical protein [Clostridium tetanomorphum]NRS85740.1 hypothetical protein [Clostridium tetanomorphum]NRZ96251.1 hypothetical protein [Clostridium tetanomorphum]
MIRNNNYNLEKTISYIGQIVLDNKKFHEYKSNKNNLSLMLAIETIIKMDFDNYSKEDILKRVETIEKFYDLDNPDMVSNKITGKSFYVFKPVKKFTN